MATIHKKIITSEPDEKKTPPPYLKLLRMREL
jgi:hypothetical protein